MKPWEEVLIHSDTTVRIAIKQLEQISRKILFVIGGDRRFLGTVTDGDIRRAILNNKSFELPILEIANTQPVIIFDDNAELQLLDIHSKHRYLPLLNDNKCVVGIFEPKGYECKSLADIPVVIMAGGLSKRLRPITENCPKPLLKVGDRPILETIICNLKSHGFHEIYISVNYKAEMIINYFSDGEHLGVKIRYLHENKPLGTAGALKLLPEIPQKPIIVMNGDVLTKVDFKGLLQSHYDNHSAITICTKEYDIEVPYGVLQLNNHNVVSLHEKPKHCFFINAGIYVLNPEYLGMIPSNSQFDMTSLVTKIIDSNDKCHAFPIHEYWLDIGQKNDFHKAHEDYKLHF